MQNMIYVVECDSTISEYTEKLVTLLKTAGFDVDVCAIVEYASLNIALFQGVKFIFIGSSSKQAPEPVISTWQYERYGCRIGWSRNKCVLAAEASDLSSAEYRAFRNHCQELYLKNSDVTVPPESIFSERYDDEREKLANKSERHRARLDEYESRRLAKFAASKKGQAISQAQYSVLLYEFEKHYLAKFMASTDDGEETADTTHVPPDAKSALREQRERALEKLTPKQARMCHTTIHVSALSCAAVAFIPVPVADTIPITAAQISMVLKLGRIFDKKLTKSDAQILLKTLAAPLAGRTLAKAGLALVPGVGWTINGAIAGTITEILGWTIVNDFAAQTKNVNLLP